MRRIWCWWFGHDYAEARYRYTCWGRKWVRTCKHCGRDYYLPEVL